MTLVFDRRPELAGRLAMHALVVGISAYRYLAQSGEQNDSPFPELTQLTAPALSAFKMYSWLIERADHLAQPLATCRLLLSPSELEIAVEPQLKELAERASMQNFLEAAYEWRNDAASNPDGATFFYQAGHGIQPNPGDFILLCDDFGSKGGALLRNAYNFRNLYDGMARSPALPMLANTQFYFVDTGRGDPSSLRKVEQLNATPVFDIFLAGIDVRRAAIFYAAQPGGLAYARRGGQTLFSQALLAGLNGAAATLQEDANGNQTWLVSTNSLYPALRRIIADLSADAGVDMNVELGGQVVDAVIHYLDAPPQVEVRLLIEPAEAIPLAAVKLTNGEGEVVWNQAPLATNPAKIQLEAGIYALNVTISPPTPSYRNVSLVRLAIPPSTVWKVNLAPGVDGKAIVAL